MSAEGFRSQFAAQFRKDLRELGAYCRLMLLALAVYCALSLVLQGAAVVLRCSQ